MPRRNPDRSERSPLLGEATRQNDASDAENGQLPQSDNSGAENEREPPNAYLLLPALAIGVSCHVCNRVSSLNVTNHASSN